MVAMTKLAGGQRFPFHVVFAVGRRDDDVLRFGALEQHTLERSQARGVKMFDDFHHRGGIEASEPLVTVNERAVQEAQTLLLNWRKAVIVQPVMRDFERAMRHIHADDFSELLFLQQSLEQSPFTAAQVQNASSARAFQRGQHRAKTLFIEADVALDGLFFLCVNFLRRHPDWVRFHPRVASERCPPGCAGA